jgi:nicotinamidase-related amidase
MLQLDPRTTALVLIDLQKGIVGMPLAPRSGDDVVAASRSLLAKFRAAGAPVVLVNVAFAPDGGDALKLPVDRPPAATQRPAGWTELIEGLAEPGDLRVTKHQWGAFFGTDLDVQLRRRGIATIVLGGIATNMGVESTARQAWEHNYAVVIAEDATAGRSAALHAFAVEEIFPLIARVTTGDAIRLEA